MKTVLVLLLCASLSKLFASSEGTNSTTNGNNTVSGSGNSTASPSPTQVTQKTTVATEQGSTTRGVPPVTGGDGDRTVNATETPSQTNENRTTIAALGNGKKRQGATGLPFWIYILIACVIAVTVGAIAIFGFVKYDRWKNQGSYMVWDSGELQLSPAFISRESEFLIDNLAADQEPGSPELQLYEIPLDSLGHQRVCIGAKRVAPRRQSRSSKDTDKVPKERRKKDGQFQMHTLPRRGKQDQIYNSANNGVNSALSEGDINEDRMNSGSNFTNQMLTNGKRGAMKPPSHNTSLPYKPPRKPITLGSVGRSGSTHLFQNRPLPAAPSKRFSKSLDRLRFLDLFPNSKHSKAATIAVHSRPLPCLPTHPSLVKSISCGNNFHQMIAKSPTGSPPETKCSLDFQEKWDTSRKSMLSHRHSKSLDTLLLLTELDWMSCAIDTHHSYESMHRGKDGTEDSPYASVETSNQTSPRCSDHNASLSTSQRGSLSPSDGGNCDENEENPYASVSDEEHSKAESFLREPALHSKRKQDARLKPSTSSEDAMPYASVRISQIPGIGPSHKHSLQEDAGSYSGKVVEDSGSSLDSAAFSVEGTDCARPASTLTYLEIIPDNARASVISETSSGYARPIDLHPDTTEPPASKDTDPHEKCNSLTDLMIPAVETPSSSFEHHGDQGSDVHVPMGLPANRCENSDLFDPGKEHEDSIHAPITDEEVECNTTGNQDDNSADCTNKESAAVFENPAFVGSLANEDPFV